MEEVENSKLFVEPEEGTVDCPLDIYTPETIIKDLSNKEEFTEDLLSLINQVHPNPNKLKKLSKIFTSLSNCDHKAIIELTKSKSRTIRMISSFLIFSKMCEWCREGSDLETVTSLYKEVFLVRYRDVDPNIRGLCVDFITDWISISPAVFCKSNYLKYLSMHLNDKSDLVRKKAVGGYFKLVQKGLNLEETLTGISKRLVEMAQFDRNISIREEVKILICNAYNSSLLHKDTVYAVLKGGLKDQKLLNCTFWNLLKFEKDKKLIKKKNLKFENESLRGNYEALHELFIKTSPEVTKKLIFDLQDIPNFISFIVQFYEESEKCCTRKTNCYLEILSLFPIESIKLIVYLFSTFKNKLEDIQIVFRVIANTKIYIFKEEIEETISLLEGLFEYIWSFRNKLKSNLEIVNNFFSILKNLEEDFESTISLLVEKSKEDLFLRTFAIRSFDVSQSVIEEDYAETKIFSSLWFLIKRDYSNLQFIYFHHHLNLKEVCELLFFINKQLVGDSLREIKDYEGDLLDLETGLRFLHTKVKKYIRSNLEGITGREGIPYLIQCNEEYILIDLVHLIFFFISPEELNLVFQRNKNKNNLVEEFFIFIEKFLKLTEVPKEPSFLVELEDSNTKGSTLNPFSNIGESLVTLEENQSSKEIEALKGKLSLDNINLFSLSKVVSGRPKALKEGLIFRSLNKLISQGKEILYDTVCINFIPHLNVNECIVLNSKIKGKSKLKGVLERKSKGTSIGLSSMVSENTTYL